MTDKIKIIPLLIIVAAVLLISSCGEGFTDRLTVDETKSLENYVMSSYFILRGDEALAESRAAWPAHTVELTFPSAGSTTIRTKNNYPEKGQRTTVTITPHASIADVYLVENRTTYPRREEVIDYTVESYYVKDATPGDTAGGVITPDGTFDAADFLWDITDDEADFNKRIKFETSYLDGTTRYETVESNTTQAEIDGGDLKYSVFDINGSLDFPAPNGSGTWAPSTDATANYSSMVTYQQEEGSALDFWSDYKIIIGTRYYTEHGDINRPTKTSVSYERVISRKTEDSDLSTKISAFFERLFSGGSDSTIYPGETLAETVIRYEIQPNGKKKVNTETQVFDTNDGTSIVTFTAAYEEDENGIVTKTGTPVAVY